MPSYLLVSIPEEDTLASPISRVKAVVGDGGISEFNIPRKLKFGTLNNLLELSDKLERFDRDYQGTCNRLIDALRDLVGASSDDLGEYLKIEERRSTDQYLREFDWNSTKYRPDRPINDILDSIAEDVGSIDQNLRTQLNQYSALKNSLQAIQRKREGNLSVRSLYGIVNRDQCVSDSEYLQTLFVAVPKNLKREWANKYETLADMVVPRSCTRIDEDDEFALYSVVVMKRAVGDFTSKARENKFTVREFNYSEEEAAEERENAMDVEEQEGSKFQQLREWIQTNFSDMFSAWLHIKALRAFVESVLRYGLSVDFVAVLINMTSRNLQKTIKALKDTYGYLEDNTNSSSAAARNSVRKGKSDAAIGSGDAFDMHEFSTVLDETYTPFPLFNIEWSFDRDAN